MRKAFIKRQSHFIAAALLACVSLPGLSAAAEQTVTIYQVLSSGTGPEVGTVTLSQTSQGVRLQPMLQGLKPGEHGFHVHEKPSCNSGEKDGQMMAALAAGGHYDPDQTSRHEGPEGKGHRGDLPRLIVDEKGNATKAVIASRLTLKELSGRSLMIHAGGDNYSDQPPMGGGGSRIACGVIK